ICGVDIASSSLAARIGRDGTASTFANTQPGIAELAAFCESHSVELVAMEATGGYEQRAFAQLSEHGLPVAVVNPRAVRQFAQSMGALEKTDAIDSGMIAWYAETKKSQPLCLAPKTQLELRARVTRLRQLTEMRTAQLISSGWSSIRLYRKGSARCSSSSANRSRNWSWRWLGLSSPIRCGVNWIRLFAPSRAWPTAPWLASWPRCRRSAHSPTRPSPNLQDWLRWPMTQASTRADEPCAEAALQCAKSCSSWAAWSLVTNRTSSPSSSGCAPPANRLKSSASPWHTSCLSALTPKRARYDGRVLRLHRLLSPAHNSAGKQPQPRLWESGKTAPPFSAFPSTSSLTIQTVAERSASQICRVTQRLLRGVEGPRRCLSHPCCSEFFNLVDAIN